MAQNQSVTSREFVTIHNRSVATALFWVEGRTLVLMLILSPYASSESFNTQIPARRTVGVLLSVARDGTGTADDAIYDLDVVRVSDINANIL